MAELPAGGTVRPITRWGDPVMHRPARPVVSFDDDLAVLVADMVATMYAADGVGLAANQVGVDLAVFVFDCADADDVRHRGVICNPRLDVSAGRERNLVEAEEGCLSLPGAFTELARPDAAVVVGSDYAGTEVRYEGTGMFARCLQHESDHLAGTVFADRLPRRARRKLYQEAAGFAADFPAGWPVSPRRS
jgi:peptide deformylase